MELLGISGGRRADPVGHTRVQCLRHSRNANRPPYVHGTVRAHQLFISVATITMYVRLHLSDSGIHVRYSVRHNYRHLGEKETHKLYQRGHVVGLLCVEDYPSLVFAHVRILCN